MINLRHIEFSEFEKAVAPFGKAVNQNRNLWFVNAGGIKTELHSTYMTVGANISGERFLDLKELLVEKGYKIIDGPKDWYNIELPRLRYVLYSFQDFRYCHGYYPCRSWYYDEYPDTPEEQWKWYNKGVLEGSSYAACTAPAPAWDSGRWIHKFNRKVDAKNEMMKENAKELLKEFVELCQLMADSGLGAPVGRTYTGFNKEDFFVGCAEMIKTAYETKMYGMIGRNAFDAIDNDIALNEKTETNCYREHVVPCTLLIDHGFEMFNDGKSSEEVAKMLESNCFIQHITKEQARKLDVDLGLQNQMPKGWVWGDDPLARVKLVGAV